MILTNGEKFSYAQGLDFKTIEFEARPDIESFPKIEIKQYLSEIVVVCIKKIWKN